MMIIKHKIYRFCISTSLCLLFFFFACEPAEQSIAETAQTSTSLKSERITKLQKLWTTTHAAIVTSSQHYQQVKTAVGENPSAKTDMLLKQIESALHTQNKTLEEWEGKLKAAEQYAKASGEEHEVVLKTQQEMTKALREVNKMQQAMETDLDYIESN